MNPAFEQFDLTGKTALITGGASGIGLEITRALARSGAKVMMAARREKVLKDAAEELMQDPYIDTVLWHPVDLSDRESVRALSEHANLTLNGVDIFVANAAMKAQESLVNISNYSLDQQVRVNLSANVELTRDLLPNMQKKRWGRIIYMSSTVSQYGSVDEKLSVYGMVKNGLNGLTKHVASEAGRDGVTANALLIGPVLTDMMEEHMQQFNEDTKRDFMNSLTSISCLGRIADTKEISGVVQLLASNAGSYITGAWIAIDGGGTSMYRPHMAP